MTISTELLSIAFGEYIEVLILLVCFIISSKSKKPLSKEVGGILLPTIVILLSRNLLNFVESPDTGYWIYYIFEISHIWLYFAFFFLVASISNRRIGKRVFIPLLVLAIIDNVSYIVSYFTGHALSMDVLRSGEVVPRNGEFYLFHAITLVIIAGAMCLFIIGRMASVHFIYWPRYIFYLAVGILTTVDDILSSGDDGFFDRIGAMHFLIAFVAFILTQVISSRLLRAYEYSQALDAMVQPLILFDNEGVCMLANKAALDLFDLDLFGLEFGNKSVLSIVDMEALKGKSSAEQTCILNKNGQKIHLKMEYKRLYNYDKYSGEVFTFNDITKEVEQIAIQTKLARYDSFTHIYNQDWFYEKIEETLSNDPDGEYYVIGSDIRDFKVFNDVFGKDAGDQVILKSAEVLRDMHDRGVIIHFGRIYGDRFGMFAKKDSFNDNEIVKSFLAIDHPFAEDYYHLNVHFGAYRTNMDPGLPVKSMFDRAYVALDSIKNDVNIRLYHYNEIMRDEKVWEQTVSSNIERALREGQLRIVVQPQVDRHENVIGGEALVRWRHPENGEISPGNFIPILEKTGLVTNADVFVWEECCKLLKRWQGLGYNNYYISVNISPTDFIFTDIYSIFTGLVEKYSINPKNLKLEITETAMMTDVLERIVLIQRLEEYGFTVELDDFGSGYSSLNMLKEIPVDVIKMDMKFLYNYQDDAMSNSRKVIGHIISMAKDLNMDIVAEGVETKEQLEFLQGAGCDVFQGYFFSKPVEVSEFEDKQGIA